MILKYSVRCLIVFRTVKRESKSDILGQIVKYQLLTFQQQHTLIRIISNVRFMYILNLTLDKG